MSSSIAYSLICPSLSELLAQERFTNLIRSCLQRILKFLKQIYPLSNSLKILYQNKDEFILLTETLLQWFHLHFYSALIGEHLFGLKRTANHRLRSLIFSVFLPYVRLKVDSLYEQMSNNNTNRHIIFYMILQILPKLQMVIDRLNWFYRLSYACGLTKYYSPTLHLANVKLTYAKDSSPIIPSLSITTRFLPIISQIISNGTFIIQLIDWWNNKNDSKNHSITHIHKLSLPITAKKRYTTTSKYQCPLCQQLCKIPTVILGSNYVYCHACIKDFVQQYHRCPTSDRSVTNEHLIKICEDYC